MRWGKPRKNVRRVDPRYFLHEANEAEGQSQESEEEFLARFEKVLGELGQLSEEELLAPNTISEAEEVGLVKKEGGGQLELSDEVYKYAVSFVRRRIVSLFTWKLRALLAIGAGHTMGALLAGLKAAGYGPTKLWKLTGVDNLDAEIEEILGSEMAALGFLDRAVGGIASAMGSGYMPKTQQAVKKIAGDVKTAFYPGNADLKTIMKATIQKIVGKAASNAAEEIKKLPAPEQQKIKKGFLGEEQPEQQTQQVQKEHYELVSS